MPTRRKFMAALAGTGTALATGATLARAQSGRKRLIVDAQIHLWKAESEDWKWVPGMHPQLPEPFTIERALALMDQAGVDRAVIVPPSWPGDRNDYAIEAAKRHPDRFAVIGRISLQKPESAELLPKWREAPGMLGLRLTFLGGASKWLEDGTADWFWPAAERAGLPVMFLAPGRRAEMARVAERHPQLSLIVDHMGMSLSVEAIRAGNFQAAIDDTLSLARYPNVSVKVSGATNYSKEPYPHRDINPHIKRVFEAFGPQRCYWGSDLTNGFDKATYRQRITHFTEALDFLSESDKDWVMGRAILARLGWT